MFIGVGLNGWSESDAFKFKRNPPQMKDLYLLGSKSNKLVDFVENSDVAIDLKSGGAIFIDFDE